MGSDREPTELVYARTASRVAAGGGGGGVNIETPRYVNQEAVWLALLMCCGGNLARYNMRRPFKFGRDVYATNAIIIARVPEWAAPWVTGVEGSPRCDELPFDPALYSSLPTPWEKMPKPIVPPCDRCNDIEENGYDPDSEPSAYELCDFADPPQICSKCGMYTASEQGLDYRLAPKEWAKDGRVAWFNARQCRKLATIGAKVYAPLKPGNGNLEAWRWEVLDLHMTGLLMPVKRGEE